MNLGLEETPKPNDNLQNRAMLVFSHTLYGLSRVTTLDELKVHIPFLQKLAQEIQNPYIIALASLTFD